MGSLRDEREEIEEREERERERERESKSHRHGVQAKIHSYTQTLMMVESSTFSPFSHRL